MAPPFHNIKSFLNYVPEGILKLFSCINDYMSSACPQEYMPSLAKLHRSFIYCHTPHDWGNNFYPRVVPLSQQKAGATNCNSIKQCYFNSLVWSVVKSALYVALQFLYSSVHPGFKLSAPLIQSEWICPFGKRTDWDAMASTYVDICPDIISYCLFQRFQKAD